MLAKVLIKTAIATGAVAGAVHLVRKYDLVTKAGVVLNTAAEKAADGAQKFVAKGIGLTDELLTKFDEKTKTTEESLVDAMADITARINEVRDKVKFVGVNNDEWASATEMTDHDR